MSLSVGDKSPNFQFLAEDGRSGDLYGHFCARPLALLLCDQWPAWAQSAFPAELDLMVMATAQGQSPGEPQTDVYQVRDRGQLVSQLGGSVLPTLICLDANHHVISTTPVSDADQLATAADAALARVRQQAAGTNTTLRSLAPVLMVPDALEPQLRRDLIEYTTTHAVEQSGVYKIIDGQSVYVPDDSVKIRKECIIDDAGLLARLEQRMFWRVLPEIQKCFQFPVTRYEGFKVVIYEAESSGFFAPHRDNDGPDTAHRRFALTVNLNSESYAGGNLRFPEHGQHEYISDSGTAIVFSCSLAHEVTPVTRGTRYALISFFYGDSSESTPAPFKR